MADTVQLRDRGAHRELAAEEKAGAERPGGRHGHRRQTRGYQQGYADALGQVRAVAQDTAGR